MNELAVVDKGKDWRGLKALVLDSVSFSDHEEGLQPWPGRILRLVWPGAPAGLHEGNRGRVVGGPRSPRVRGRFHQRADHGGSQAGRRGRR